MPPDDNADNAPRLSPRRARPASRAWGFAALSLALHAAAFGAVTLLVTRALPLAPAEEGVTMVFAASGATSRADGAEATPEEAGGARADVPPSAPPVTRDADEQDPAEPATPLSTPAPEMPGDAPAPEQPSPPAPAPSQAGDAPAEARDAEPHDDQARDVQPRDAEASDPGAPDAEASSHQDPAAVTGIPQVTTLPVPPAPPAAPPPPPAAAPPRPRPLPAVRSPTPVAHAPITPHPPARTTEPPGSPTTAAPAVRPDAPRTAAGSGSGATPGAASPAADAPAAEAIDAGWRGALAAWLAAHRIYPEDARRAGEQGRAVVRFTIDHAGQVLAVALVGSSGADRLDDAAQAMLRGKSVPPLPPEMPQDRLTITVTIRYALTR